MHRVDRHQAIEAGPVIIPSLTGLRFVAAMMVVIGHGASSVMTDLSDFTKFLSPLSGAAMTLFFTLSGFVMWLNYSDAFSDRIRRRDLRNFAAARFARLWPMYVVTLLIALGWIAYTGAGTPETFRGALLFFFGIQGWVPAVDHVMAVFTLPDIAHYWSISAEMFLYCIFPLLCIPITRLRSLTSVISTIAIGICVYTALQRYLLHNNSTINTILTPMLTPRETMGWVGYYSPYIHLFEFATGCLACRLYTMLQPVPRNRAELAGASALACISIVIFACTILIYPYVASFGAWFETATFFQRVGPLLPLAFLIFYVSRYDGLLTRTVSQHTMIAGGEVSYSIYLLHPPLAWIWIAHVTPLLPAWVPTPSALSAC